MEEISINLMENIKIGHATDEIGGTGCTVIICKKGCPCGVDIRGGGPASRETPLLDPLAAASTIHAVLLSGGSAFGLDAAGGVMDYLEEKNIGFDTGVALIPLVCQSSIFDLVVGSPNARPDKIMGYTACCDAENFNFSSSLTQGNIGAGTGATVGKYAGLHRMMKSGLGHYTLSIGDLKVAAIVIVNALGDIRHPDTGEIVAGLLNENLNAFSDTEAQMFKDYHEQNFFTGNTTIGAIITNGKFDKAQCTKISGMAHNGFARSITPVHTSADGDSIYTLSVGEISADINVVGTLAARVMSQAIYKAILHTEPAYGLKSKL